VVSASRTPGQRHHFGRARCPELKSITSNRGLRVNRQRLDMVECSRTLILTEAVSCRLCPPVRCRREPISANRSRLEREQSETHSLSQAAQPHRENIVGIIQETRPASTVNVEPDLASSSKPPAHDGRGPRLASRSSGSGAIGLRHLGTALMTPHRH